MLSSLKKKEGNSLFLKPEMKEKRYGKERMVLFDQQKRKGGFSTVAEGGKGRGAVTVSGKRGKCLIFTTMFLGEEERTLTTVQHQKGRK